MPLYHLGERRVELRGPDIYVAPNASLIGSVSVGQDCSFWFGAVVRGDNDQVTIGAGSNVQDNCVVHTDPGIAVTIGAGVTIGHMSMLHGCTIGDGSLIGINAVILNNAVIGRQCIVGANALIPEGKIIPDRALVVGSPGRVIRTLSEEEVQDLVVNAHNYVDNARLYADRLCALEPSSVIAKGGE